MDWMVVFEVTTIMIPSFGNGRFNSSTQIHIVALKPDLDYPDPHHPGLAQRFLRFVSIFVLSLFKMQISFNFSSYQLATAIFLRLEDPTFSMLATKSFTDRTDWNKQHQCPGIPGSGKQSLGSGSLTRRKSWWIDWRKALTRRRPPQLVDDRVFMCILKSINWSNASLKSPNFLVA
jgi:hypothetical protein